MRRKILIAAVIVLMLLGGFTCLFFGVLIPKTPSGWDRVHVGMSRSEVLAMVGSPQQSGWPEKIIETWERSGLVSRRKLSITYEGERVQVVCEGIWARGFGWLRPRKESL